MSGSIGESPLQLFATYAANESKYATANVATNAEETSLVSYFKANAASITTPAALLKNYKALTVVLGAFNLSSLVNSPALVNQLLTQNPSDKSSTAYRIGNAQYIAFATALSNWSPPPFSTSSGINSIVSAYETNTFEQKADTQSAGLQKALYFNRTAGSITSLTQLQSDPDLLAVAVEGLNIPLTAYDNLSFTQQTQLLQQKLNLADLQKPAYVQKLAQTYLIQQQLLNPQSLTPTASAGSLVNLFSNAETSGSGLLSILSSAEGGTSSLLGTTSTGNSALLSLFA
jgi:hypothetical protein